MQIVWLLPDNMSQIICLENLYSYCIDRYDHLSEVCISWFSVFVAVPVSQIHKLSSSELPQGFGDKLSYN